MDQTGLEFAPYRGRRVVVLGATGFIGRWVARALTNAGAHLSLLVRNPTTALAVFNAYAVQGDLVEIDLWNLTRLRLLLSTLRPAIIFNLAGYGVDSAERDRATAYRINVHLVSTLCETMAVITDATWPGQAIVHTGSALEYGAIGSNLAESSRPHPTTLYGQSKLAGTQALAYGCRTYAIRGVTARLFTVYGPGEHDGRLWPALQAAVRTGRPLPLTTGLQQRDFTYVEDVALGLLRLGLAETAPGEVVNLATGQLTSVRSFARTAARLLDMPDSHLYFGVLPTRSEEMEHAPVSIERCQQLLGWYPETTPEEGMMRALHFERSAVMKEVKDGPAGGE